MRESSEEAVNRFREIVSGRSVLTWDAVNGSVTWNRIFGPGPSWAGTFCHHPHDIVECRAADMFVPLNSLAVREYSWNKDTPGAASFRQQLDPGSERIIKRTWNGEDASLHHFEIETDAKPADIYCPNSLFGRHDNDRLSD